MSERVTTNEAIANELRVQLRHANKLAETQQEMIELQKTQLAELREILDETVNYVGRNVVCTYPDCGCDGARNCDAIRGPSSRATEQNIEGKINPAAACEYKG